MSRALVSPASDPQQVARAARRVEDERKQYLSDLAALLRVPSGVRVLFGLLQQLGEPAYPGHDVEYHLGRRSVIERLKVDLLEADDDAHVQFEEWARKRRLALKAVTIGRQSPEDEDDAVQENGA